MDLLFDADMLAFEITAICEVETDWEMMYELSTQTLTNVGRCLMSIYKTL